jgi:PAS domain-containing protein
MNGLPIPATLPPEAQAEVAKVLEWFGQSVERLEGAYGHLEKAFAQVSRELEVKQQELEEQHRRNRLVEESLNSLMSSMKPGAILVGPDATITSINPSAAKLLGVEGAEVAGKSLR